MFIQTGSLNFFTQKDFPNREDAMSHFKKVGQRVNITKTIEGPG